MAGGSAKSPGFASRRVLAAAILVVCATAAVPSAASAFPRPLFEDRYSNPRYGTMDLLAQTGNYFQWATFNVRYTGDCPEFSGQLTFRGSGPPNGPWTGTTGWWHKTDGSCDQTAQAPAVMTPNPVDINVIGSCSDGSGLFPDTSGGVECQTYRRVQPIDLPASIFQGTPVTVSHPLSPYGMNPWIPAPGYRLNVNPETGKINLPQSTHVSEATGDYGALILLSAEAMTGGKAGKRLLTKRGGCLGPIRSLLSKETAAIEESIELTRGEPATKANIGRALGAQVKARRAVARCLSRTDSQAKVSRKEVNKVQARLATNGVPRFIARRLAGADPGALDVLRLNLRSTPVATIQGRLAKRLRSKRALRALRHAAAALKS